MSKSRENDNGRYFEFLITKQLFDDYGVILSDRAQRDQVRDANKPIEKEVQDKMLCASEKISNWINEKISLNNETTVDRLPDIGSGQTTHSDISIRDAQNRELAFSLKWNSGSVFHGRPWTACKWAGIPKEDARHKTFKKNTESLKHILFSKIPVGTKFADGGIYDTYQEHWSNFAKSVFEEMKEVFLSGNEDREVISNLFRKIVGDGSDQFRIIAKKNGEILIQDLTNLKPPTGIDISIYQKDTKTNYVWYLRLDFNNGVRIEARSKQDSRTMKNPPPLKPDWKVEHWGNSGMSQQEL